MTDHRQISLLETRASDINSENNCALLQPPKLFPSMVGAWHCSRVGEVGGVVEEQG